MNIRNHYIWLAFALFCSFGLIGCARAENPLEAYYNKTDPYWEEYVNARSAEVAKIEINKITELLEHYEPEFQSRERAISHEWTLIYLAKYRVFQSIGDEHNAEKARNNIKEVARTIDSDGNLVSINSSQFETWFKVFQNQVQKPNWYQYE